MSALVVNCCIQRMGVFQHLLLQFDSTSFLKISNTGVNGKYVSALDTNGQVYQMTIGDSDWTLLNDPKIFPVTDILSSRSGLMAISKGNIFGYFGLGIQWSLQNYGFNAKLSFISNSGSTFAPLVKYNGNVGYAIPLYTDANSDFDYEIIRSNETIGQTHSNRNRARDVDSYTCTSSNISSWTLSIPIGNSVTVSFVAAKVPTPAIQKAIISHSSSNPTSTQIVTIIYEGTATTTEDKPMKNGLSESFSIESTTTTGVITMTLEFLYSGDGGASWSICVFSSQNPNSPNAYDVFNDHSGVPRVTFNTVPPT